jgi:hypothetical protein
MDIGLTSKLIKDIEVSGDSIGFVPDRIGQMIVFSKEAGHLNTNVMDLEDMRNLKEWLEIQIDLIDEYNQGI